MKTKKILHVPHASTFLPDFCRDSFPKEKLSHEIDVMTDWFCDELFEVEGEKLIFPVSRLFCDVERFREDENEDMAKIGMGVCYRSCSDLSLLRQVPEQEKEFILREYYDKHHAALTALTEKALKESGGCLIFDYHSFFPTPLPYESDRSCHRPDFCIGVSDFHTPEGVKDCLFDLFLRRGYSVKINSPFADSIVPMKFYRKDKRVASVMIEVNRSLYLSSPGRKNAAFSSLRSLLTEAMEEAGEKI